MSAATQRSNCGTALVIDDEATSRCFLEAQLEDIGYHVVLAKNGAEGIAQFIASQPDLVFVDIVLPDIDGYQVAQRIKDLSIERFVPLLFLTALSEDEALVRGVESGGDDFLTKPCKNATLRAKIWAMERIRALYERSRNQNLELHRIHDQMMLDQELAERVFTGAVMSRNVAGGVLQTLLKSTDTFNGDILLSAYTPSGGLCALLGDFTGHGLAAAMGALPVSESFHTMVAKGIAMMEMLEELNRKLKTILPTGMFLACCLVHIDRDLKRATVWNSGMPDILIRDGKSGQLRHRVRSMHPALAVLGQFLPNTHTERLTIAEGDLILLCSDGVTEAHNGDEDLFGNLRLSQAVVQAPPHGVFNAVVAALAKHTAGVAQDDDISMMAIPCLPSLFVPIPQSSGTAPQQASSQWPTTWRWSLYLQGNNLRLLDPVPTAINQLTALHVSLPHRQRLFVILSALYSNALDHGVLGLCDTHKDTPEATLLYASHRQQALQNMQDGHISIGLEYHSHGADGMIIVRVEDSGKGFDHRSALAHISPEEMLSSDHGLPMLRGLCHRLYYEGSGNRAIAEYLL